MQTDCFPEAISEWIKFPISRIAEVNPKYRLVKGREYPFVEMAAVGENFGGIQRLDSRKLEGSGLSRFKVGDTLFAKITPCPENGKVAFVHSLPNDYGLGSTEFIVLSPRENCNPRFLFHLLCCHAVRGHAVARMEGSTGRQRVPDDAFKKRLLVPVPSPEEQEAIARILDAVDTTIDRTREAIELARELKTSLVHQLLHVAVHNEDTRKSEVGLIPRGWDCDILDKYIESGPTNGVYRPESDYSAQGTRIVRIDSFDSGRIHDLSSLRRVKVEPVIEQRYAIQEGDLLINRVNSLSHIGKAAYVPEIDEPTIFESNMMSLRCGNGLLPEFLIIVLCSDIARKHWLARAKPAVNQASINQRDVRELPVPVPHPDEQREIARIISAADKYIDELEALTIAQRTLKKGLMHDLLTGEVCVSDISIST